MSIFNAMNALGLFLEKNGITPAGFLQDSAEACKIAGIPFEEITCETYVPRGVVIEAMCESKIVYLVIDENGTLLRCVHYPQDFPPIMFHSGSDVYVMTCSDGNAITMLTGPNGGEDSRFPISLSGTVEGHSACYGGLLVTTTDKGREFLYRITADGTVITVEKQFDDNDDTEKPLITRVKSIGAEFGVNVEEITETHYTPNGLVVVAQCNNDSTAQFVFGLDGVFVRCMRWESPSIVFASNGDIYILTHGSQFHAVTKATGKDGGEDNYDLLPLLEGDIVDHELADDGVIVTTAAPGGKFFKYHITASGRTAFARLL